MSASLVGSEMCIRDRPMPAPELAGRPAHACVGGRGAAAGTTMHRACASVSYTHLTLPTICSV
eukprot:6874889-Alexandrium_andersonii.AAC.1